ncbi:MAG: DpnII family type II restriction endonuclease, partial [Spirochaetales bacterium]|nr:DpnII family type II restriction endonuclease [Spirochaetales bacterium]
MKKITQTTPGLLEELSVLETDWKDDFSKKVLAFLSRFESVSEDPWTLVRLLDEDFDTASTVIRLFLELSKDEYTTLLRSLFSDSRAAGKSGFKANPLGYVETLAPLLLSDRISETLNRTYTWQDILTERLKGGRGSAIKGQKRGRELEDYVEAIVKEVFGEYEARVSFTGMDGISTEKADFAIPCKDKPEILIEVKGYGATGSKQTDVIGDINRIIQEKRHDTVFLLFTDGVTWKSRESDFRKLVDFQNSGFIYRIYTKKMRDEFKEDL